MIWDYWDQRAMGLIFAGVWVTMRIAYVWPACLAFPPGHSPASRDDRYVRPVIRSRI